jgi:tripartite-type tricarboxylate transporter receptor subunit TctC
VLNDPEMRSRFTPLGLDISGASGPEVAAIIKADVAKWAKVIKEAGITAAD